MQGTALEDKQRRLLKMIKLHTFQLVKLDVNCLNVNIHYFREAVRTIYMELRGL